MERVTQREESRPLGPGGSGGGAGPRVVEYDPARREHVEQFRALNLAWITEHFAVEDADRRALDDAEGEILRPGGCILVAEEGDGAVVGACALVRHGGAPIELAKMAVAPAARGRGVGRLLGEAAVARAKALGVPRVELLSNTALAPAIALYRGLGFVEVPLGGVEYRRANIRMVLDLAPLVKCVLVVADDLPPGLAANAAAVLALSLGRRLPDLVGPDVRDGGGTTHAGLTWIPLPVLRAPRGALARLRARAAADPGVYAAVDLPDVAQAARRYDDYAQRLAAAPGDAVDYAAVALYGERATVTGLTGDFPLLR
ncbi:MAG TPA: GNAT family N-acetyltransferase [Gemmatimonadaceae bacterium]|nr:GNAT family N-acetyltransferase [Gemmatimonadaceae bacterium]